MKTHSSKSYLVYLTLLIIVLSFVLAIYYRGGDALNGIMWKPDEQKSSIQWGAYDPDGTFTTFSKITIDHHYSNWLEPTWAENRIEDSKKLGRDVFLSIEPWPKTISEQDSFLTDIVYGKYDDEIEQSCNVASAYPHDFYISFAHEMDHDLTARYPWSALSPEEFIDAFRYFVDKCRASAPNIKIVWAPVGDQNANKYWPGDSYVDVVGVPVYSFPDFDISYYGHARSFEESFREKYDRVVGYGKPIMIAELGVAGDSERKIKWLNDAQNVFFKYPKLKYVVLFNSKDTEGVWGENFSTPDWRIDTSMLNGI